MQRQRISPPSHILPPPKIRQQLRGAGLLYQCEIIEPEFLEAAVKPSAILHLARNEKAPRARRETGELDIPLLGIVATGRKHIYRPSARALVENPKLSPALEWLNREHQRRALRNRMYGGHPHDPVSAPLHE